MYVVSIINAYHELHEASARTKPVRAAGQIVYDSNIALHSSRKRKESSDYVSTNLKCHSSDCACSVTPCGYSLTFTPSCHLCLHHPNSPFRL
jgi:hypothetical protein